MSTHENQNQHISVLNKKYGAGPKGLGDPDDTTLRQVEREIMIPKKMREKAKAEKCTEEVAQFTECCKGNGLSMVFKCRPENAALKSCLIRWYEDTEFKKICTQEYLQERSEFRRTGIKLKESQRIGSNM